MYTVATKSMLAKLMATENIKVEHRTAKTASFHLKTRTLTCPIWKDMTGDIYDLLMGHEISHALNTPLDGWHESVTYAGGDKKASSSEQKAFKHFLNVIEDARIEKLVKRRYPGLRRPMHNGYKELLARDFFGLSGVTNFNELYLIDKLNLTAKCGSLLNIRFTEKEQPLYDAMMATETWEDVVTLARSVYAYSKDEQEEGEKKNQELNQKLRELYKNEESEGEGDEDSDEDSYEYGDEESEGDGDYEEDEDSEGDGDSEEDNDSKKDKESDTKNGESVKDDEGDKAQDHTTSKPDQDGKSKTPSQKNNSNKSTGTQDGKGAAPSAGETKPFVPRAKTDEAFRNAEDKLVEHENVSSHYVNIPKPNLKDIVVPAEKVNAGLTEVYSRSIGTRELGIQLFTAFKKKNNDYISLLAKEFEMKKAAKVFQKSKIADSGDINVNKLANYRLEDHIFKKMMLVHKGKCHGLVLILDKSGSMGRNIEGAMEQIMILAMFCRKVNIPFAAYSFTDSCGRAHVHDFGFQRAQNLKQFSTNEGDLTMGALDLREMFNSNMPASKFTQAITNHLVLAASLAHNAGGTYILEHERLGGTPLNEALVALRDVIRDFRMNHRLDIVNAIVVHDGDSNGNHWYHSSNYRTSFSSSMDRVTLVDPVEKIQVPLSRDGSHREITVALMKWLQMTAHCGVFGFYITDSTARKVKTALIGLYTNKQGIKLTYENVNANAIEVDNLSRKVLADKFLESYSDGYTRFYFIPGCNELKVEDGGIESNGKAWTPSRLLSAFRKVNKKKQASRVLVSRFIELLAV